MTRERLALALACVAAATAASACGENRKPTSVGPARPLSASICSPVSYGGPGHPRFLIAMTSWFQGAYKGHGVQTAQAMRMVLAQRGWRAGRYTVGIQACEETDARTSSPSATKCARIARAFAENPSVLGVVGPLTSECAMHMLPTLNAAPGGPLALINGSNSYLGLTRSGPGSAPGEPDKYYPTGRRSYVRLAAADNAQGTANAVMARRLGVRRVFVVEHNDPYGLGLAETFRRAAHRIGLGLAGTATWDEQSRSYRRLAARIRDTRAQAVFIAGPAAANGPKLVADLTASLGPSVQLMAGITFNDPAPILEAAGPRAEDFLTSTPVLPNRDLPPKGRGFAAEFEKRYSQRPCCFSVHDAQATHMLLDAIARSGGNRASVTENLLRRPVHAGLLGDFKIDANGDTTLNTVGIYRIHDGRLNFETAITPDPRLLAPG
jgi:branched-chain amino acid transport system substrate-binding protein